MTNPSLTLHIFSSVIKFCPTDSQASLQINTTAVRWVWKHQDQGIPWNKALGLPCEALALLGSLHFTAPAPPQCSDCPVTFMYFYFSCGSHQEAQQSLAQRGLEAAAGGLTRKGIPWGNFWFWQQPAPIFTSHGPEYPFISFPFSFSLLAAKTEDKGNSSVLNPPHN